MDCHSLARTTETISSIHRRMESTSGPQRMERLRVAQGTKITLDVGKSRSPYHPDTGGTIGKHAITGTERPEQPNGNWKLLRIWI